MDIVRHTIPLTLDHLSLVASLAAPQPLQGQLRRSLAPLGSQKSEQGNIDANDIIGQRYMAQ